MNEGRAPMPLVAGPRLGPYEILDRIGVGGMSACGQASRGGRASASGRGGGGGRRWGMNDEPPPLPLLNGAPFGPYEIVALSGVGGQGGGYPTTHTPLGRTGGS